MKDLYGRSNKTSWMVEIRHGPCPDACLHLHALVLTTYVMVSSDRNQWQSRKNKQTYKVQVASRTFVLSLAIFISLATRLQFPRIKKPSFNLPEHVRMLFALEALSCKRGGESQSGRTWGERSQFQVKALPTFHSFHGSTRLGLFLDADRFPRLLQSGRMRPRW